MPLTHTFALVSQLTPSGPSYPQADVANVGIRARTIPDGGYGVCYISALLVPSVPQHKHNPKPHYINQCSFQHGRPRVEAQVGGRQTCVHPPNTPSPVSEQPTGSHGHLPAGNIHESPSLYLSGQFSLCVVIVTLNVQEL